MTGYEIQPTGAQKGNGNTGYNCIGNRLQKALHRSGRTPVSRQATWVVI